MRGITLFKRKYMLDLLSEVGMLGCRASDTLPDGSVLKFIVHVFVSEIDTRA